MSAKINNLRNLRKKDFEIIKELSLLGAHIKKRLERGMSEVENEALYNLISRCGDEFLDETGESEYDMNLDNKLISEYNELVFWEVLAKKLAGRDTLEDFGADINENNVEAYQKIKKEYEKRYLDIFKVSKKSREEGIGEKGIIFDDNLLPY